MSPTLPRSAHNQGLTRNTTPLIFGHRGAAGLLPENTLPGFARAIALQVDGIELDVYLAHGQLWVIHDATVDRTTNGHGALLDLQPAQLRALDAGGGNVIPALQDVLVQTPDAIQINIELKGPATAEPVWKLTHALPQEQLLISAFDHQQLHAYRGLGGTARVGVLLDKWDPGALDTAQQLSAWSIHLSKRIATRARVRRIQEAGFKVLVYTVNLLRSARRLQRFGVDGLFTDRPDRISRAALADPAPAADRNADP